MGSRRRICLLLCVLVGLILAFPFRRTIRSYVRGMVRRQQGAKTVSDRLAQYGAAARSRLLPRFEAVGLTYPPAKLVMVGVKDERVLEVWAADEGGSPVHVHTYPIQGASGIPGPKLREGDMQVPEGLYRIESLNPNSRFHLSLRINYPNENDLARARSESRDSPGSDIMIHGSTASIGCLAMGDEVAEDLFVLAADTGLKGISVILTPVDFREREMPELDHDLPEWAPELYRSIREALGELQREAE